LLKRYGNLNCGKNPWGKKVNMGVFFKKGRIKWEPLCNIKPWGPKKALLNSPPRNPRFGEF